MTLDEFLVIAEQSDFAPKEDVDVFAVDWRWHRRRGHKGFGDEKTAEDWMGGFDCWFALKMIGLE